MQQAVAPCPEIVMSIKGKPTRSLLDSGSEVTLVNESYFKEHIEHRLLPSSGSYNNSHNLFSLRGVEEDHVPLSKHFECDIEVGGQIVHRVGILVKKDKIPLAIQVTDVAKEKLNRKTIEVATGMVSLFDSITPKEMAEFQRQDNQIAPIFAYVKQDQKPSKKVTYQIRSKLARKLALQWDRLILKQGFTPTLLRPHS